ncbi:MAG: ATP-grasp domain-containing protein [Candidatus Odinarchaeia archaeon]
MKILVYEHFSGGGYVNHTVSPSYLSEGFGLLNSILRDVEASGNEPHTTLDYRIANYVPPIKAKAVTILRPPNRIFELFREIIEISKCDAVLLVAPEINGTLRYLAKMVESEGKTLLGAGSDALSFVLNKVELLEIAERVGFKVNETIVFSGDDGPTLIAEECKKRGFPIVLSTLDSSSTLGLTVVNKEEDIPNAIEYLKSISSLDKFLLIKPAQGQAASAIVISNGEKAKAITLAAHEYTIIPDNGNVLYLGGYVPLSHKFSEEALKYSEKLVSEIDGLTGMVCVSLMLTNSGPVYVNLTPTITPPYIGLRKVTDANLVKLICDAVLEKSVPNNVSLYGTAYFRKVFILNPENLPISRVQPLVTVEAIAAPPFHSGSEQGAVFLVGEGDNLNDAKRMFTYLRDGLYAIYPEAEMGIFQERGGT